MLTDRECQILLRSYCHSSTCREFDECPLNHVQCESLLGLDTAMAWYLSTFYHECICPACSDKHARRASLIADLRQILLLDSRYQPLVDLLNRLGEV